MSSAPELGAEARRLTRHLLDSDCPAEIAERYVRAHAGAGRAWQRDPDPASRFALAHPWAIGLVDAGGMLGGRAPALRAKLLLMAAILEASPHFADRFLPRRESAAATVVALAALGARSILKLVAGVPLVLALDVAA
jgi:hypothetical protein